MKRIYFISDKIVKRICRRYVLKVYFNTSINSYVKEFNYCFYIDALFQGITDKFLLGYDYEINIDED